MIRQTEKRYLKLVAVIFNIVFSREFYDSGWTGVSSKEKILKDEILLYSEGRGKSERGRMFIID